MDDKVVPIKGRVRAIKSDADILLEVRESILKLENPVAKQQLKEALKKATITIVSPYY